MIKILASLRELPYLQNYTAYLIGKSDTSSKVIEEYTKNDKESYLYSSSYPPMTILFTEGVSEIFDTENHKK